jgi:hypothetical protein
MKTRAIDLSEKRDRGWYEYWMSVGIGLVLLAQLSACATIMPVRTDFDRQTDFSGYRTFTWVSDNPLIVADGSSPVVSALNRGRIVSAIENELERIGYVKAPVGAAADFAIAFTVGTRERIDVDSYPMLYRDNWRWRPRYWDYEIRTRTYQEGMLGIDIFDGSGRVPIWHGFTHKRITGSDMADPAPAIQQAVAAILAKFPP